MIVKLDLCRTICAKVGIRRKDPFFENLSRSELRGVNEKIDAWRDRIDELELKVEHLKRGTEESEEGEAAGG